MSKISVTVTNEGEVIEDVTEFLRVAGLDMIRDDVHGFVTEVHETAVNGLQSGGSGRVYEKTDPRRTHQASARGEYPATDTGNLVSRTFVEFGSDYGAVYTNVWYGRALELRPPERGGRPWLTRAWGEVLARRGR